VAGIPGNQEECPECKKYCYSNLYRFVKIM